LLIAIYAHNNFNEKVSVKRARELRIKIINEVINSNLDPLSENNVKKQRRNYNYGNFNRTILIFIANKHYHIQTNITIGAAIIYL